MLEIGSVIDGKYKVLSQIGRGGMSTVYLAINEKANKPWAVKEVRKGGIQNFEVVKQSLIVEMDLLKKLNHPNLPSIVDVIDREEDFLIVMDYIEGMTLDKVLREQGAQNQEDVVKWALQICDVLNYLHTRKPPIIYRDMKPSNIMLRSDGTITLIDFGTAREFKEKKVADTTCLGTQGYAAPEQFGGQGQTDERTDIYSLGATLYHLLTGHNPSEPPYEMYPLTTWNSALSSGLEGIVSKCTQKNPNDRYYSVEELMYALEHYRDLDKPIQKSYKRKLALMASTIIIAIGCGIGSLSFYQAAQKEQKSEYEFLIELAQRTPTKEEMEKYYLQAIHMDSTRKEAYQGLLELYIEDGIFSDEEEQVLLQMNASVEKYIKKFHDQNKKDYADFCFDVGNAYWFYYVHEESRQSSAVPWFQAAADYYVDEEDKQMEYKRCEIYMQIGNFHKKIIAAQIEGTDVGMYGEYWNNLLQLKKYNDEMPDRELITLRLYREIVTRTMQYAKYLNEDGVPLEEITTCLKEIQSDMGEMSVEASSAVASEVERIKELIVQADEMIRSSYKGEK